MLRFLSPKNVLDFGRQIAKTTCPNKPQGDLAILLKRSFVTSSISGKVDNFKILGDENINNIDKSLLERSNIELDDLELSIGDQVLTFNLTWLRDSCHCNQCTHPYSRQRLFIAKDFRRDQFRINQVHLLPAIDNQSIKNRIVQGSTKSGLLKIDWTNGHESIYSLDWLFQVNGLNKKPQIQFNNAHKAHYNLPRDDFYSERAPCSISKKFWNVREICSGLTPVDYNDLVDRYEFNEISTFINANRVSKMSQARFSSMRTLTRQLIEYGLAKVVNVPCVEDYVLKVARSLAYERPTGYGVVFNVVVEPSEEINLAYSSQEFDLHSDLTYREMSPGVQLLHCIRNSADGGLSYFSDAFKAAKVLKEEHPMLYEVLLQFPITFGVEDPYRKMKFRHHIPMIIEDTHGELNAVYYSPFTLPPVGHPRDIKLFYLAQDEFTRLLHSDDYKFITKMESGDLYMFHNRRVLHGRSNYDATSSSRFLQGCYMDWDEIVGLNEKLISH